MAFDFNAVMQDAQASLQSGGSNSDYKYPLLYPQQGTLTFKLLFNPKSNLVKRAINRHTVGEDKIACMKTYGKECPICKVLEDAENSRGIDLGKMRSIVRGISLVQFIEATYKVDNVKAGDIVMLMYPWTVYKDLSTIMSQAKSEAELASLIASNTGYLFTLTRGNDNKYTTNVAPFRTYQTCQTDDEFATLLNNLDSLNEMVLPGTPTEAIMKDVTEVTTELTNTYLVSRGPQFQQAPGQQMPMSFGNFGQQPTQQFGTPAGGFNQQPTQQFNQQFAQQPAFNPQPTAPAFGQQPAFNQQQTPAFGQQPAFNNPQFSQPNVGQPAFTPAPNPAPSQPMQQPNQVAAPQASDPSKPPCFGRHGQEDMNKCLLCPSEIACSQHK